MREMDRLWAKSWWERFVWERARLGITGLSVVDEEEVEERG
jgi:hypothetical protein